MTFKIRNDEYDIYFVTARIEGAKHLFIDKDFIKIILDSLKFLRDNQRIKLFAFVVMPNHVHFLIKPLKEWTTRKICTEFKKFTAHQVINLLKEKNKTDLLDFFKKQADDYIDRDHKVWQQVQAKNCYSQEFLSQKLNYIHNNPINKGWQLVEDRQDYKYSSAIYYDSEYQMQSAINIDNLWEYVFNN